MTFGTDYIKDERYNQFNKGHSLDNDAQHTHGELAMAAVAYASPIDINHRSIDSKLVIVNPANTLRIDASIDPVYPFGNNPLNLYPNTRKYLPRDERIKQLAIAGAFCAAEIDRLLRK